jgi:ribosome-associated heat shock protein Hsp15
LSEGASGAERHRLDVWLWHARIVSTRTACAALVKAGRVRLNGVRVTAPGHVVRSDDVITISLDGGVRVLRVSGFIPRRGDAKAAATTYIDMTSAPDSHSS